MNPVRALFVWVVMIAVEFVHGVLRMTLLEPYVGDFRASQIAVFTGSLIIVSIASLFIRWIGAESFASLVAVGLTWLALTLLFDLGFGRFVLHYSWGRLGSDYKLSEGGLLPIGLAVLACSPLIARWLSGAKPGIKA